MKNQDLSLKFLSSLFLKATPRNERLKPLLHVCLHLFRHIAQKCSAIHEVLPVLFRQSDEKSDGAIAQQSLCGAALIRLCCGKTLMVYYFAPKIEKHLRGGSFPPLFYCRTAAVIKSAFKTISADGRKKKPAGRNSVFPAGLLCLYSFVPGHQPVIIDVC